MNGWEGQETQYGVTLDKDQKSGNSFPVNHVGGELKIHCLR